jgi:RNA polymerase sigma-70 factor (ECF subfamily)
MLAIGAGKPQSSGEKLFRLSVMSASHGHAHRPPSRRLGDGELMRLVAVRDDPLAFAIIYDRHSRAALALATQICSRHAVAEEVVQEAFLSLWRSRGHYDDRRGAVRPWLLWIVRNRAIDVLRQGILYDGAPAGLELIDDLLHAHEHIDDEVSRREDAREVLAALDGLPQEQSSVIALAYYGGYTQAEIASMLGTPIGTVKGRMRLGLRKMAQSFLTTA